MASEMNRPTGWDAARVAAKGIARRPLAPVEGAARATRGAAAVPQADYSDYRSYLRQAMATAERWGNQRREAGFNNDAHLVYLRHVLADVEVR